MTPRINLNDWRPLNTGEWPQRGNCYQVELPALRGVALVQSAFRRAIKAEN